MNVLVTGGAGFIGSHIVDELARRGHSVTVYDNFSTGFRQHLEAASSTGNVRIIEGDILDTDRLVQCLQDVSLVFHLAANADVRGGMNDTCLDVRQNILGTQSVLEAMRSASVKRILFTSSATVYGEPTVFPTPETYASLQTSLYGASKLAAEALIQAYGEYFGIRSQVFRFVSWVGERYSHGVIFDFVRKLKSNPRCLEILGDGTQKKSYLDVEDGVRAIFIAMEKDTAFKSILNLGHVDYMDVVTLADIVCDEMGLHGVEYQFSGGSRGWSGDSPFVHLDISRLSNLGFQPIIPIEKGVRRTVRYLLTNEWLLQARSVRKG